MDRWPVSRPRVCAGARLIGESEGRVGLGPKLCRPERAARLRHVSHGVSRAKRAEKSWLAAVPRFGLAFSLAVSFLARRRPGRLPWRTMYC